MTTALVAANIPAIEARARGSGGWRLVGTTQSTPFIPPSAWVGQAVDLRITALGVAPEAMAANGQYTWTVGPKAVADWLPGDTAIWVVNFDGDLTHLDEPTVYWVDKGFKQISVSIVLPNQPADAPPMTISGRINVVRPNNMNLEVVRQGVRVLDAPGTTRIQLIGVANAKGERAPGIQFIGGPLTREGTVAWIQLTNTNVSQTRTDGVYVKATPNYVLDGPPVHRTTAVIPIPPVFTGSTTNDSPLSDLTVPPANFSLFSRVTAFRTYLMWKPNFDGAIEVPLMVVNWRIRWSARWNAGATKWDIFNVSASHDPPQDTSDYPSWSANIDQIGFVRQ